MSFLYTKSISEECNMKLGYLAIGALLFLTSCSSLETIADILPKSFVRCHKTCIVNLSHITKIEKNTIFLSNKKLQTIGRKYLTTLKNSYLTYIMGGGI